MSRIQNASSFLDLTAYKRFMSAQKTPGGTTLMFTAATVPTIITTGTNAQSNDTDGEWLDMTTGAVSSNNAGVAAGTVNQVCLNWLPEITFHCKTGSSLTSIRFWAGVSTANMGSTNLDNESGLAFRFDDALDTGTFTSHSGNNGGASSSTIIDTGVTVATNTKYVFRIETISPTEVNYYINDVLVSTHTTSLPVGTTIVYPNLAFRTNEAVAKNVKFSRWVVWQV